MAGGITIREAKFDRSRLVLLNPTATKRRVATRPSVTASVQGRAAVRPRAHDSEPEFAVDTLIRWSRSVVNFDEYIGALSTYLGHVSPADA